MPTLVATIATSTTLEKVAKRTAAILTLFRRQVIHKPKGGLGSAESQMSTPTKGVSTSRINTPTDGRGRF